MFLKFKNLEKFPEINHIVTTRKGGISKGFFESMNLGIDTGDRTELILSNYDILALKMGFTVDNLVLAHQDHTDETLIVTEKSAKGINNIYSGIDGFITNVRNIAISVRFADCQGILFYDPVRRVIAAAHCGWRGNAKNIISKIVLKMEKNFKVNPKNLVVGISASLGPCCADFSDPYRELPVEMHEYIENKKVNLWECSINQLLDAGVRKSNIELTGRCTVCENDIFFSYRGGKKKTGHMAAVISLN